MKSPTQKTPSVEAATREITFAQAINEALAEEMRRDPTVFIIGEDVAEAGTPFKVLSGLVKEFGTERVIDSPISEAGIAGIGVGAAFLGCQTYRFHGHHVGDIDRAYYRSKAEEEEWKSKRDPVKLLAAWLEKNKLADGKLFQRIENEVSAEIKQAVTFALNAPYPAADEVDQHVYA